MKKFIVLTISIVLATILSKQAIAAKPSGSCVYIKDGTLVYKQGHYLAGKPLTLGFDIFGYNYQAHIFNGTYANAYLGRPGTGLPPYTGGDSSYINDHPTAESTWMWPFRNLNLEMKWNDAWLSNMDCNSTDNNSVSLDMNGSIGSGAWLTNHVTGNYTSNTKYQWVINTSSNKLDIPWAGTTYSYVVTFNNNGGILTGVLTDPYVTPSALTGSILDGLISSTDNVTFKFDYGAGSFQGVRTYVGNINSSGNVIGNWTETGGTGADHTGSWSINGFATKIMDTCILSDFVKIVSPPKGAYKSNDIWYTSDNLEIGPDIWNGFVIIQEISSDPCGEYGEFNFKSPIRSSLGNWK